MKKSKLWSKRESLPKIRDRNGQLERGRGRRRRPVHALAITERPRGTLCCAPFFRFFSPTKLATHSVLLKRNVRCIFVTILRFRLFRV